MALSVFYEEWLIYTRPQRLTTCIFTSTGWKRNEIVGFINHIRGFEPTIPHLLISRTAHIALAHSATDHIKSDQTYRTYVWCVGSIYRHRSSRPSYDMTEINWWNRLFRFSSTLLTYTYTLLSVVAAFKSVTPHKRRSSAMLYRTRVPRSGWFKVKVTLPPPDNDVQS